MARDLPRAAEEADDTSKECRVLYKPPQTQVHTRRGTETEDTSVLLDGRVREDGVGGGRGIGASDGGEKVEVVEE